MLIHHLHGLHASDVARQFLELTGPLAAAAFRHTADYDVAVASWMTALTDEGSAQEQVTLMKEAAKMLADDAAADWLFVLPNLIVADKGITGIPKNAISESFDVTGLSGS